jgi:hypothetical protein
MQITEIIEILKNRKKKWSEKKLEKKFRKIYLGRHFRPDARNERGWTFSPGSRLRNRD